MIQILEIGGSVRDELLNLQSKDKDFVVVLDNLDQTVEKGYLEMKNHLLKKGYTIFLETPDCYTIRAKFPDNHQYKNWSCDFVLARKEVGYYEGTRKPILKLGNIYDDVYRRDFTCNSLYKNEKGEIIDLTGQGISDLKQRILRTPLTTKTTLLDDPLRIFRAIRFCITKHFELNAHLKFEILNNDFDFSTISVERVREELYKCFKYDTLETLKYLEEYPLIKKYAFKKNILWLKPTMEK